MCEILAIKTVEIGDRSKTIKPQLKLAKSWDFQMERYSKETHLSVSFQRYGDDLNFCEFDFNGCRWNKLEIDPTIQK